MSSSGQRVMAQQGGFVRGQIEQGRALARAPDASSRHVPSLRYPFIPAGAALSVRGSSQRTGLSVAPTPTKPRARSVSYEWYGNNCGSGTLFVHFPHDRNAHRIRPLFHRPAGKVRPQMRAPSPTSFGNAA